MSIHVRLCTLVYCIMGKYSVCLCVCVCVCVAAAVQSVVLNTLCSLQAQEQLSSSGSVRQLGGVIMDQAPSTASGMLSQVRLA